MKPVILILFLAAIGGAAFVMLDSVRALDRELTDITGQTNTTVEEIPDTLP